MHANRGKDPADDPEKRQQALKAQKDTRVMVKRARQAARITRKKFAELLGQLQPLTLIVRGDVLPV